MLGLAGTGYRADCHYARLRCTQSTRPILACSGTEGEACPRVGAQQLARHLGLGHVVERLTSAVQRDDVIDIDILERRDGLAHIVLIIWREVEAADNSVNFLDARRCLSLL